MLNKHSIKKIITSALLTCFISSLSSCATTTNTSSETEADKSTSDHRIAWTVGVVAVTVGIVGLVLISGAVAQGIGHSIGNSIGGH